MQGQPYERQGAADIQRLRTPVSDSASQARPPVGYARHPAAAYPPAAAPYGGTDFVRGMQAAQGQPVGQPSGAYVPPVPAQGAYAPPVPPATAQGAYVPPASVSGAYAPPVDMPVPPADAFAPAPPEPSWQKGYTAPVDPFDEPGVDPKLKRQRSSKVYSRRDPFWDAPDSPRASDKPHGHAGSHAGRKALAFLAVLLAVGVALYGVVFRVRTIDVEGNTQVSDEEVIALSGVAMGTSIAWVDAAKAEEGINRHCYLVFQGLERQLPNRVVIRVKERTAAAVMYHYGSNYTIDARGMVLAETDDLEDTGNLPQVSGMDVSGQYGCKVGSPLRVNNEARMAALKEILVELKVLSAQGEVTMIKLSDLSHVLLETREGYSVSLGGTGDIHAKLKAMLAIKAELNKMGKGPGTIDVSNPEQPNFLPEAE